MRTRTDHFQPEVQHGVLHCRSLNRTLGLVNDMPETEYRSAGGNGTDGVAVDELHLTLRIPKDLPEGDAEAVRRALAADEFLDRLRRAAHAAVRTFPELSAVRVLLAR